jgi:UDP-N-acetylmuramoyl-L-alanyl-D-glutamate--2,6-diaminopimelate ligase
MDYFKQLLRGFFPQDFINKFYHLPVAFLANLIYGFPTRKLIVIGVTGTDGKTTTTNMIYRILKAVGKKVSMVSTVNAYVGGKIYDTGFHVTSPDPFMVQKFARAAVNHGDKYLILEVTSHALDQYRFWGFKFDVGMITNITHEHLDYHKTFENYKSTKVALLKNASFAIINDNLRKDVAGKTKAEIITFGLSSGDFNQKEINLKLKIPGDYNIENALAAISVAFALGIDRKDAQNALENYKNVIGRMEDVENSRGLKIIIDFAHTPNGLEQVLKTLKLQTGGKLISLIGCEGFRDIGKRALMGEIAQKLSDIVIVTSVDPRGQQNIINRQISEGAKNSGAREGINFFIIEDREKAIDFAINTLAKRGDLVGIFGKGHEKSMNMDGEVELPWSDQEAVKKILNG